MSTRDVIVVAVWCAMLIAVLSLHPRVAAWGRRRRGGWRRILIPIQGAPTPATLVFERADTVGDVTRAHYRMVPPMETRWITASCALMFTIDTESGRLYAVEVVRSAAPTATS